MLKKYAAPEGLRIGLALGAGGARGFAHIPVLEALDELGVTPVVVSGASIGAVMGAGYCAGMSGTEIRSYVEDLFKRGSDVIGRLWKVRPRTARELFASGGWSFSQLDAERVLEAFLPEQIPRDFSALKIPLKIVASDFYGWRETVLEEGDLRKAHRRIGGNSGAVSPGAPRGSRDGRRHHIQPGSVRSRRAPY